MNIMQIIQESRVLKDRSIFSLEPTITKSQYDTVKQAVREKDVIINNNKEKIQELENEIIELKQHCNDLENKNNPNEEGGVLMEMTTVLQNYENLIAKMTTNYRVVEEERNIASTHLVNLEFGFNDLWQKYERLKVIALGYQQNQVKLLREIDEYSNMIQVLEERYQNLKRYANQKLLEANAFLEKNDKKHISEIAKIQSKVLQSEAKISELEKTISILSLNKKQLQPEIEKLFIPLPSNLLQE